MTIIHCDICRAEVGDRGHIWSNTLPAGDPLRNVCATVKFTEGNRAGSKEIDLCGDCVTKFLRGVRGVVQS